MKIGFEPAETESQNVSLTFTVKYCSPYSIIHKEERYKCNCFSPGNIIFTGQSNTSLSLYDDIQKAWRREILQFSAAVLFL